MAFQFIAAMVMMVISVAISYYSAKRVGTGSKPAPDNPEIPTAKEGTSIPVVFGTILVKNPQVIDYFDPKTEEIKS